MKRLFDIFLSATALLLLAPLMLFVGWQIRRKLGSPVLFRQTRPGLNGQPFQMVKFRTMRDAIGPDGRPLPDSERMTPFGSFLRTTSLDELPELWNVLKGEMSLVGPRPLLMEYLPLYSPEQARRHEVRPGVTGWAQINGRNALSWEEKFRLDVWYVDNQSFRLDLKILALTVKKVFVREGITSPAPIRSLPGVVQHSIESLRKECVELAGLGVPAVILFGVPEDKDAVGSCAWDPEGILQHAIREVRSEVGRDMVVMADLCLDEFTDHGHCGVIGADGDVDNDRTLELYQKVAVAQAEAGVDICAPSGMMDGQVAAIRSALDSAGAQDTAILAYSAKYASALYGPFRDAVGVEIDGGEGVAGDRRGYQQDHRNLRESLLEIRDDVEQGADMVRCAAPYRA